MNQDIAALSELDQVFGISRVSREDDRMSCIVDPISERWLNRAMVHGESRHLNPASFVDNALLNILCFHYDPFVRYLLIHIAPYVYVEFIGLLQVLHHLLCASGAPDSERSSSPYDPARQPKIGDTDDMIRVQMSQEQRSRCREWHLQLIQALDAASTAVKDQFLISGFNQNAGSEAVHNRPRGARTEQGHL